MTNKANWYDCLTNFSAKKHSRVNQKKLNDIKFTYKIENLGLKNSLKQALDILKVGEYVDCRRKPTAYNTSGLNAKFNNTKEFQVTHRGQVILRIA